MKFTDKTRSISDLHLPSKFKHALITACKKCAEIVSASERHAQNEMVTAKMWEDARNWTRRDKHNNHLIREARKVVQHVIELVSADIGASLSVVKHALETRHHVDVARPFKLSLEELTEDGRHKLKSQGVRLVHRADGWRKLKIVRISHDELAASLYEQARAFYTEPKKRGTG